MTVFLLLLLCIIAFLIYNQYRKKTATQNTDSDSPTYIPTATPTTPAPSISVKVTYPKASPVDDMEDRNPDKDAWEGAFWDAMSPLPVKATLDLSYIDGKGNRTRRTVDVREFDRGLYGGIFIGHCHLRDDTRTFRFDRIQECIDVETGEIVHDVCAFLYSKYEASPDRILDNILNIHGDMFRILLFLGKADGRLTAKERTAILEHLKATVNDERLNDKMIKKVLGSIDVPTIFAFKLCCGRLAKTISLQKA